MAQPFTISKSFEQISQILEPLQTAQNETFQKLDKFVEEFTNEFASLDSAQMKQLSRIDTYSLMNRLLDQLSEKLDNDN